MALLSSSDYPAIRALIDTALTAEELPDAAIGYDQVVGVLLTELAQAGWVAHIDHTERRVLLANVQGHLAFGIATALELAHV